MAVYHIESITIRDKSVIPLRVQWPATIAYQSTHEVTGDQEILEYTGDVLGVDQSTYFLRMRMDDGNTIELRNSDIVSVFQDYEVETGSTIYWGSTLVPPPNIGKVTDVYIAKNGDCYSLTETGWKLQTNIRGPQGPAGVAPNIGTNGHWFINGKDTGIEARGDNGRDGASPVIDPVTKHWFLKGVDLGVCAEGQTPYIGANGNWWIGVTDTGVIASGSSLLPSIDPVTNHWFVDGVDTGVVAVGQDGATPVIHPTTKHWMINGVDTGIVAEGIGGTVSLTISTTTNNWEIDGVDTGIPATGPQGPAGAPGKDGESFQLFAVYSSETDMDADEPNVPENSFVALITASDVLLYIKSHGYIPDATSAPDSRNNFIWVKNLTDMISISGLPGKDGQTPHIDQVTKHWMIGDVDTGVSAEPLIPYIGPNNNWWVGITDTGVSALGTAGISPTIDQVTKHWMIGTVDTGVVAEAPIPSISTTTNNWVINGVDTGISAKGRDGLTPYIGGNGNWFIGSTDTGVSASGAFPVINLTTGNWEINGVDTGVSATGPAGTAPTISIDNNTKNWLIDGLDTGVCSVGRNGDTPVIGANNNWWINGVDTGISAKGANGETPHIDQVTKHWMIGTVDTGVVAEGKMDETELQIMKNRLNSLIASKHSLGSCDYCFLTGVDKNETVSVANNANFLTVLTERTGNMEISNDCVVLRPNRTYRVVSESLIDTAVNGIYMITTKTTPSDAKILRSNGRATNSASVVPAKAIITTGEDPIEVFAQWSTSASSIAFWPKWASFIVEEINNPKDIDPIEYIMGEDGIEDTPVGTIVPYMGVDIPKHYLLCDGSILNIDDYPDLAAHFVEQFGAAEHFGGDGLTTFAVPDLRGEFLRGSGENSHENNGSGAEVGEHQDGTIFNGFEVYNGNLVTYVSKLGTSVGNNVGYQNGRNHDYAIDTRKGAYGFPSTTSTTNAFTTHATAFTARPTNTSINWIIKCEKTPFVQIANHVLGVQLNELILDEPIPTTAPVTFTLPCDVTEKFDVLKFELVGASGTPFTGTILKTMECQVQKEKPIGLVLMNTGVDNSGGGTFMCRVDMTVDKSTLTISAVQYRAHIASNLVVRGIKYEKTSGGSSGGTGTVEISAEPDNQLEKKPDGLYVPKGLSDISAEPDNALEEKPDGLYVENVPEALRLKVNMLSRAKHTTEEVQFLFIGAGSNATEFTTPTNKNILDALGPIQGNMEIDADGYVTLLAEKTYRLHGSILAAPMSGSTVVSDVVRYFFADAANNCIGVRGYRSNPNTTTWNDTSCSGVITPDVDTKVGFIVQTNTAATVKISTGYSSLFIEEINNPKEIDPVEYVMGTDGIEASPVGNIISYMGTTPPQHYLACDGTEYQISDYAQLAQHFIDEFGSVNHFGGDGVDTFCVPDLRGEFLRGTGELGADVGEHQDATEHPGVYSNDAGSSLIVGYTANPDKPRPANPDTYIASTKGLTTSLSSSSNTSLVSRYASRPTNTSVLYCIKYESTPFVQINSKVVGVELDEEIANIPLTNGLTGSYAFSKEASKFDDLLFIVFNNDTATNGYGLLSEKVLPVSYIGDGRIMALHYNSPTGATSFGSGRCVAIEVTNEAVIMNKISLFGNSNMRLIVRGRKYAEVSDSTGGNGSVEIDPDTDNAIEERPDGLFVPKGITVSTEEGNEIEQKSDGIYVKSHNDLRRRINQIYTGKYARLEDAEYFQVSQEHELLVSATLDISITVNQNVLSKFVNPDTNMEVDADGYVKLTGGKRYRLISNIFANNINGDYGFKTKSGKLIGSECYATRTTDGDPLPSGETITCMYAPEEDEYVGLILISTYPANTAGQLRKRFSSVLIEEIPTLNEIDPVEYIMKEEGIEDNPVGTIVPFMGNNPAKHYLACDGTIYNIVDYPYLADHFRAEFGAVEHFGGDGIDTFAVPDLRGEFLRGTGELGADVGEHQEPTIHPMVASYGKELHIFSNVATTGMNAIAKNMDKIHDQRAYSTAVNGSWISGAGSPANGSFSSRPTNTSVLWMIKAEPTPFVQTRPNALAIAKNDTLFDGLIEEKKTYNLNKALNEYDDINVIVVTSDNTEILWDRKIPADFVRNKTVAIHTLTPGSATTINGGREIHLEFTGSSFYTNASFFGHSSIRLVIKGVRYVDAPEGSTGTVEISGEADNQLEQKEDGLYVKKQTVSISNEVDNELVEKKDGLFTSTKISEEEDNAIIKKSDGLFVENVPEALRLKVNMLDRAKHSTEEVQFFFASQVKNWASPNNVAITANQNMLSKLSIRHGNMEVSSDNYIKLLTGKTYRISVSTLTHVEGAEFAVVDRTGTVLSNRGFLSDSGYNSNSIMAVITPDADMEITVMFTAAGSGSKAWWPDCSYVSVEEINNPKEIDPVNYLVENEEIEDSPVGNIISFMGLTPPSHYLICDGTEYPISSYPQLAEHFLNQFGSVNYFGGDGVDTFKVPDMRNEFIRGYHGDASDALSGNIGEHQNPTTHLNFGVSTTNVWIDTDAPISAKNYDGKQSFNPTNGHTRWWNNTGTGSDNLTRGDAGATYTSRPTNVAVLFCIKYERTPFAQLRSNALAVQRNEELFNEVITAGTHNFAKKLSRYDEIWFGVAIDGSTNDLLEEKVVPAELVQGRNISLCCAVPNTASTIYGGRRIFIECSNESFKTTELNIFAESKVRLIIRGIKYVDLPEGTGAVEVSAEEGNALEYKDDGLYAAKEVTYTDAEVEEAIMELFYPEKVMLERAKAATPKTLEELDETLIASPNNALSSIMVSSPNGSLASFSVAPIEELDVDDEIE